MAVTIRSSATGLCMVFDNIDTVLQTSKKGMVMGKPATVAQFTALRQMYIAAGGDKAIFQQMMDDHTFRNLFQGRVAEAKNILTFELTATVNQDGGYIKALEMGAPNTPGNFNARKVGDLYPPASSEEGTVDFILRNFPKGGGSWDKALAWAEANGYEPTNPREMFAVVEQHDLRQILSLNWLYLVATTECSFGGYRHAVFVDVVESNRNANLGGLGSFGVDGVWFLFRKKI